MKTPSGGSIRRAMPAGGGGEGRQAGTRPEAARAKANVYSAHPTVLLFPPNSPHEQELNLQTVDLIARDTTNLGVISVIEILKKGKNNNERPHAGTH